MQRGYEAYLAEEETGDFEQYNEILNACDDLFYANEQLLIGLLEGYAETMKL